MLDLESKEILKLIKAYFPQCFDKKGYLIAQRLKESIADFIARLEIQKEFEAQGELKAQNALEIQKSQNTQENSQAKPEFKAQVKPETQAKLTQEKNIKESLSKESYALTWLLRKAYAKASCKYPYHSRLCPQQTSTKCTF